jgi:hypothetical protein
LVNQGVLSQLKFFSFLRNLKGLRRRGREARERTTSSLEMSDRDFDRQATLGGLLSALRGTNESMNHK